MPLTLTSSAFGHGSAIPSDYTCDGRDMSPHLAWTGAPPNTVCFVLIVEDPDAPMGTWVHWVMYDIPSTVYTLPKDIPSNPRLSNGTCQGVTDFGHPGYGGPCPPSGTHRYYFRLYALDAMLGLSPHVKKKQVFEAMQGHVLDQAELMGTYRRR